MWLLLLASVWGASYMLIKIGLRDLPAPMVAWMRIALAALVLVPVAASQRALGVVRGRVGTLAVVGAVQVAGPFLLIALGEEAISSALAGILVATAPIFTALLAIRVDHEERSEGARLVGIVLGIAGVATLFGLDLSDSGSTVLGGLAVVGAGLGYAVGGFLVKHRLGGLPPIGVAAWVMVASTAWLLPAALAGHPLVRAGHRTVGRRDGPGGDRNRRRVRDLLHPDRQGGTGAVVDRGLPGAGLRGRLRDRPARGADHGRHGGRAGAHPGRLLVGRGGLDSLAARRSNGATR